MADTPTNPPAGGPINPPVADNEPQYSQEGKFLTELRERILDGTSAYGDPKSRRAQAHLQEIDAKLALGRRLGEVAPEEEPWTEARAARERLARDFPDGNPATTPWHPAQQEFVTKQVATLGALSTAQQADLHQQLVDDLGARMTPITGRHSLFDRATNTTPHGSKILEKLLAEAEPAVLAFAKAGEIQRLRQALKLDRQLLERFVSHGRNITNFQAAAARYGVK